MGNPDIEYPLNNNGAFRERSHQRVEIPPHKPFYKSLKSSLKETFFPDDPFRQFKKQPPFRKFVLGLEYFFPILEWGRRYTFSYFKSDLIAGITIASLAIPQGISYAKLGNVPPIVGLYSSFVPPLVYAMMGSSRDLAVGPVAVGSILMSSILESEVSASENPELYLRLAFTATFFAGALEASLGLFRLGFIVDFLSHASIVGFMGGTATVVCLQQLKGVLGLKHFTQATDVISVIRSIFSQVHEWRWETGVMGCCFVFFISIAKYISKKRPKMFWVSAMTPLASVILGSIFVYVINAEKHGVQVIGHLKKGINPPSAAYLAFGSSHLPIALKTGIIVGVMALAEGIAVGRSFAILKNYHIDGNKEMIAFGTMNIVGSLTSCYLTAGPFSRTAVNFSAGCKTAVSNIVMAIAVMLTLMFLIPLFRFTPLVALSSIIIVAMIGVIDYQTAIHLWKVDKFDFTICMAAYAGVVFGSVEIGLGIAISLSILRVLMFVARPRTFAMGNIPNSMVYRNVDQYSVASTLPGILILGINAPVYFANAGYLRERIWRWLDAEEEKLKSSTEGESGLQYLILDLTSVGSIDTSGIDMLQEVKKHLDRRGLKLALVNPGSEVMKKMEKSKCLEEIGQEWIYLTVGEAVGACNFMLHLSKPADPTKIDEPEDQVQSV